MSQATYTPEIGQELAALYAAGFLIRDLPLLGSWAPTPATFYLWRTKHPEFARMLEEAEPARAQALAEQTIDIVDTDPDPKAARNRMHARQWLASKLNRQKYGEKVEVAHTHTLDMGAILAEAEARLVTSARILPTNEPHLIEVNCIPSQPVETLEELLA